MVPIYQMIYDEPHRTGSRWYESPAQPIFFPRIDDSHCDRIHSSLTAVLCFDNSYVGKQSVTRKEYCAEYRLKELQESIERCTGRSDIYIMLLKAALNTIQLVKRHTDLVAYGRPFSEQSCR